MPRLSYSRRCCFWLGPRRPTHHPPRVPPPLFSAGQSPPRTTVLSQLSCPRPCKPLVSCCCTPPDVASPRRRWPVAPHPGSPASLISELGSPASLISKLGSPASLISKLGSPAPTYATAARTAPSIQPNFDTDHWASCRVISCDGVLAGAVMSGGSGALPPDGGAVWQQ
jgi:hypothetical protein